MRKWALVIAAVAVVAAVAGYVGNGARAGSRAQDCEDWVNETNDRVNVARQLLYPADRPDAFEGSAEQAAEELYLLFEEQADSDPPDGGFQLNGDLIEAMSVGAEGLAAGGPDAATLVVFAKSIIYNADARLLSVVETC